MKKHWSCILMLFLHLTSWVPLDKSCPSCETQFPHLQKAAEGGYKDKETKAKGPWRGIHSAPLGESWELAHFWFSRCWPTATAVSSPDPSRLPVSLSSREPEVNQGDLEHVSKLRQRLYPSSGVMPREKVTQFLLVMTFLLRSKRLLISWLQSPSAVILEPPKMKSAIIFPSICHEVMGPHATNVEL